MRDPDDGDDGDDEDDAGADPESPVEIPIDGVLDLHPFSPREVKSLVTEYLGLCLERGIFEVRLIHGKGTGALRRTVEHTLARDPRVERCRPAGEGQGGWGATIVTLKRPGVE